MPDAARFSTPLPDPFVFDSRVGGVKNGLFASVLPSFAPAWRGHNKRRKKTMVQKTKTLKAEDLAQFYGTERWYRHGLVRDVLYTDGVQYIAEHGGAYWLLDDIAFSQVIPKVKAEEFQSWTLTVRPDHTGTLICDDGNGKEVFKKDYNYTDFPLDTIMLFCVLDGTGKDVVRVLCLPSER
jgi:hypothetical protein